MKFPERTLKRELLSLIRLNNPQPKYVIDELAKASGHEVVVLKGGGELWYHHFGETLWI